MWSSAAIGTACTKCSHRALQLNIATCKASTMAFNILNGRMLSQHLVMSHPSLFPWFLFSGLSIMATLAIALLVY